MWCCSIEIQIQRLPVAIVRTAERFRIAAIAHHRRHIDVGCLAEELTCIIGAAKYTAETTLENVSMKLGISKYKILEELPECIWYFKSVGYWPSEM